MKKIHPLFIMTAPDGVLVSCAQIGASQPVQPSPAGQTPDRGCASTATGQHVVLRNCAHCHGADAHGDEGPDLHNLDWTDDSKLPPGFAKGKRAR